MARIHRRKQTGTRWDQDNELPLNPGVLAALFGLAAVLAGLFVLFWLVF